MIDTIAPYESNLLFGLAKKRKRMAAIKINAEEVDGLKSILLELAQSKVKIRSNKNIQEPKVDIILNLKGQLYGYTGEMHLENPDEKQALQDEIAKKLEISLYNLLEKLQKLQVDPIQLGETFRRHYRGDWSKELWNEALAKVEFNIKVNFEITTSGTLR
jgi:spore germination protein